MEDDMYIPEPEHMTPQSSDNKQGRTSNELSDRNYKACWTAMEQSMQDSFTTYKHLLGTTEDGDIPNLPDILEMRKKFLEESATNGLYKMQSMAKERGEDFEITEEGISEKIDEYMEHQGFSTVSPDFEGIAKELARLVLPVSVYSQMYWKANLRNIFNFISLRSDPHAQYEIRVYSDIMLEMLRDIVPLAVEAFEDYWLHAVTFSNAEITAIRTLIRAHVTTTGMVAELTDAMASQDGVSKREIDELIQKF